jgi:hypothetical protein
MIAIETFQIKKGRELRINIKLFNKMQSKTIMSYTDFIARSII